MSKLTFTVDCPEGEEAGYMETIHGLLAKTHPPIEVLGFEGGGDVQFSGLLNQPNAPFKMRMSDHHPGHLGLRMAHKLIPVSINEAEFNYLRDFIRKHGLRSGFDLATGFGVSAVAMGMGLKTNAGRLVSIDSYNEEMTQDFPVGLSLGEVCLNADGYKFASWMAKRYGLMYVVALRRGWSPYDARQEIMAILGGRVDVALLDCPKSDADFTRDLLMLKPFLAKKYAIFLHDSHTIPHHQEIAMSVLGLPLVNVLPGQHFPFMCATNLIEATPSPRE